MKTPHERSGSESDIDTSVANVGTDGASTPGIDRRKLVRGGVIASGAAWTVPTILDSFFSPAAAASGPPPPSAPSNSRRDERGHVWPTLRRDVCPPHLLETTGPATTQ